MNEREKIIRLWFDMWLTKERLRYFREFFTDNSVYIESWGPEYHGSAKIKLWFDEWNTRGTVLQWDIKQFFHKENQTMVEWYFKNQMNDGRLKYLTGFPLLNGQVMIKSCFSKSSVATSITMTLIKMEIRRNLKTKK